MLKVDLVALVREYPEKSSDLFRYQRRRDQKTPDCLEKKGSLHFVEPDNTMLPNPDHTMELNLNNNEEQN